MIAKWIQMLHDTCAYTQKNNKSLTQESANCLNHYFQHVYLYQRQFACPRVCALIHVMSLSEKVTSLFFEDLSKLALYRKFSTQFDALNLSSGPQMCDNYIRKSLLDIFVNITIVSIGITAINITDSD